MIIYERGKVERLFLVPVAADFRNMENDRLTKADVIGQFTRHVRAEGWSVETSRVGDGEVDIVATMGGAGLFVFAIGEISANGRGIPIVRETSAAFLKAATLRGVLPFERICVVAAGNIFNHPLAGAAFAARSANIELWFIDFDGSPDRLNVREWLPTFEMLAGYPEVPLKRWPQDYFRPIEIGDSTLYSNGDSLGPAIIMDDELDDEQFELQCLSAAVAGGRQTLSFGGFYISRSDEVPGACMLTVYDYSFGKDYRDINAAIEGIHNFAPLKPPSNGGLGAYRGYVIGRDMFKEDRLGVFLTDNIVLGLNLENQKAAVSFIRSFIESRRERITDDGRYR